MIWWILFALLTIVFIGTQVTWWIVPVAVIVIIAFGVLSSIFD